VLAKKSAPATPSGAVNVETAKEAVSAACSSGLVAVKEEEVLAAPSSSSGLVSVREEEVLLEGLVAANEEAVAAELASVKMENAADILQAKLEIAAEEEGCSDHGVCELRSIEE
jgi:hypothetical protein